MWAGMATSRACKTAEEEAFDANLTSSTTGVKTSGAAPLGF